MIKRILTICAALFAGLAAAAAGTSCALAQGNPYPPGAVYSPGLPPYPPGGYPADYRRAPGAPNFDLIEDDDEGPNTRNSAALPPPGPVLSPDDPRYGRPMGAPPVYSDRAPPAGPVLSPDDPRYGRPMGAPPVYSDRAPPAGPVLSPDDPRYGRPMGAPPVYSDRAPPSGPILSPDDPRYGRPDGPPQVIYGDRPGGPPREVYSDRSDQDNMARRVRPERSGRRPMSPDRCSRPSAPTASPW